MSHLSILFNIANLYVLPFWILMIFLPRWDFTQKLMNSLLLFVPLIVLYIYLFATGLDAQSADIFANPTLTNLASVFGQEKIIFAGWVHFLVIDLFLGRYIYLVGKDTKTPVFHSLALCLFAGPIGLLSHILTTTVKNRFFSSVKEDVVLSK